MDAYHKRLLSILKEKRLTEAKRHTSYFFLCVCVAVTEHVVLRRYLGSCPVPHLFLQMKQKMVAVGAENSMWRKHRPRAGRD